MKPLRLASCSSTDKRGRHAHSVHRRLRNNTTRAGMRIAISRIKQVYAVPPHQAIDPRTLIVWFTHRWILARFSVVPHIRDALTLDFRISKVSAPESQLTWEVRKDELACFVPLGSFCLPRHSCPTAPRRRGGDGRPFPTSRLGRLGLPLRWGAVAAGL